MTALMTGVFRIGRDAELRSVPSGEAVINLSLAYNWGKKQDDGNRATTWIEAALWGKRAESMAEYLVKGGQVFASIEDLHIEDFHKADGTPGHKLAGRIAQIQLVGRRDDQAAAGNASTPAQRPAASAQRQAAPARTAAKPSHFEDMDDDIPF